VILVEQLDRLVNSHMYRDSVLFLVSEETVVMGWIFWIFPEFHHDGGDEQQSIGRSTWL
jgi:hypothetical protein